MAKILDSRFHGNDKKRDHIDASGVTPDGKEEIIHTISSLQPGLLLALLSGYGRVSSLHN
jgi:hypothetical protein